MWLPLRATLVIDATSDLPRGGGGDGGGDGGGGGEEGARSAKGKGLGGGAHPDRIARMVVMDLAVFDREAAAIVDAAASLPGARCGGTRDSCLVTPNSAESWRSSCRSVAAPRTPAARA